MLNFVVGPMTRCTFHANGSRSVTQLPTFNKYNCRFTKTVFSTCGIGLARLLNYLRREHVRVRTSANIINCCLYPFSGRRKIDHRRVHGTYNGT